MLLDHAVESLEMYLNTNQFWGNTFIAMEMKITLLNVQENFMSVDSMKMLLLYAVKYSYVLYMSVPLVALCDVLCRYFWKRVPLFG